MRIVLGFLCVLLGAPLAWGQGVSEQPLPPPPGASVLGPRAAPRPAAPHPTVPVLKPPARPARKPAPHAIAGHKPAPERTRGPAHERAAKPAPKPAAKPVAPVPATPSPPPVDTSKGSVTGLPLPRWVSFRSDEVNLRAGPGTQYPIQWVYHRRDYPVQVLREFEVWRLVQLQDGTKGWVHQATIAGRRGFVVQDGEQVLRADPQDTAAAVAKLEPDVVGVVRHCPVASDWCEVQAGSYRGWLKRAGMFGVSADETVP